jgi:hypothetical protein
VEKFPEKCNFSKLMECRCILISLVPCGHGHYSDSWRNIGLHDDRFAGFCANKYKLAENALSHMLLKLIFDRVDDFLSHFTLRPRLCAVWTMLE